jgi:S1-C subfamily serine protease
MGMTDYTTTESTQPLDSPDATESPDSRPPALPPPPPPRRRRPGLVVLLVLLVALVAAAIAYPAGQRSAQQTQPAASAEEPVADEQAEAPAALDAPSPVPEIAAAVLPSVARVDVGRGSGSAVIYRDDGYLVTNNHVVGNAPQVEVTLSDGQSYTADVVGTAPEFDLAVLQIDEQDLPAANFAESAPQIGSTAVAIGSPFGLDATVTAGVISAEDRELLDPENGVALFGLIQTDAAINPGNSGGALADDRGRVVGINTAILSQSGTSSGVGFAIPSASVVPLAEQIIDTGEVNPGFLGVGGGGEITPEIAEQFGTNEGAVITEVQPNTPAAQAGLQAGDIIVEVDGDAVDSFLQLRSKVLLHQPGDEVTITYFRDGERQQTTATLGEMPSDLRSQ